MDRAPEPELMDDAAQAMAYAEADFSEPHGRFIELYRETAAGTAQLRAAGLDGLRVERISDRHLLIHGRLS